MLSSAAELLTRVPGLEAVWETVLEAKMKFGLTLVDTRGLSLKDDQHTRAGHLAMDFLYLPLMWIDFLSKR